MQQWKKDSLLIKKYDTRQEMGTAAAKDAEEVICRIIAEKGQINMIFAAAPSQNEMLAGLLSSENLGVSGANCVGFTAAQVMDAFKCLVAENMLV